MAADDANEAPGPPLPLDVLESPFLDREVSAGPGREEWGARLDVLEAESPFLSGFAPLGPGVVEPEEESELADKPCTGIIGNDDRVPVRQAWDIPHRWICQISSRRRKGGKQLKFGPVGTGVLISPRFVLTAAHLLRDSEKDDRGQWVDSESEQVFVTPARNDAASGGRTAPFGRYEARGWRFPPKYNPRSPEVWKHDYALIELKEPAGAKRTPLLNNEPLCFWGSRQCGGNTVLEVVPATQLAGRRAFTAGYPGDLGGGTRPHVTSGMLSGVDIRGRREIMNYDADGCPGQSGSPIWIERDSRRCLVGIFTKVGTGYDAATGNVSLNQAVRITQDVFDQISRWLEAVLETPWLEAPESLEYEGAEQWSEAADEGEQPVAFERLSTVEDERGDDSEVVQFEDEEAEAEKEGYDGPVGVERDVPKTSATVAVGQRVELDLTQTHGADLAHVRWTIPGRVVRDYQATVNEAKLVEVTPADLERPSISFFWVDAGAGRAVRAKVRRKSGAEVEFVALFDVEAPTVDHFSGKPGVTRIERDHGTVGMRFGKLFEAPGINWTWKITTPPHRGGFVKDVQILLADRTKIQRLRPGGSATRTLVRRHPSNTKPHLQLDGDSDNQPIYTPGLADEAIEAGKSRDNGSGTSDSPIVGLASLDKTVAVNDRFTYYIMFKPTTKRPQDAIWVPIAKAAWFWKATADQRDRQWSVRKAPKMEPAIETTKVDFPLYQSNASGNEWRAASPASSHEQFAGPETAEPDELEDEEAHEGEEETAAEPEATFDAESQSGPDEFDADVESEVEHAWAGAQPPGDAADSAFFEAEAGADAGAVDPFRRSPYLLSLEMTNEALSRCADGVERDPDTNPLCGAVADVTGNPELPALYAHNPVEMLYVASLAKIYPMYVAFELRKRVQEQAMDMIRFGLSTATPGWERQVFGALEKAWKPKLKAAFPTLPAGMPNFAEIFVLSSTGHARFAENDPPLTDADLDFRPPHPTPGRPAISPEFKTPPGKFRDWMRLVLRWSNNEAASKCIRAIGYPYINGMLRSAGFFDRRSRAGLWLSGDYLGHDWLKADGAGQPLSPRWARLQRRKVTNFGGTAFQVARLLTLLAQERLVDKESSREMLSIMTGVAGIGSYVRGALAGAAPPRPFSAIASKIGCGDEVRPPGCGFTHDCAIVRVDRGGDPARTIRYVVVALGGHPNQARADLRKMVLRFHDCVVARHP